LKFPAKTKTICRLATHVIAGNSYLADYARQTNQNVSIVPTTIDTEKYQLLPRSGSDHVPVIGWTGTFSTVQHLDTLAGALKRLAQKESFRLVVIGPPVYKIDGVDVEAVKWRSATEVADLRQIDIGIMPLPDESWTRGKCGCKALQYMALAIPTVCSPVGVNAEIIQDGVNGLLATTEDEWVEKLTKLLHDPELRARLGDAGRKTVETKYSAAVHAPRVYEILRSVVARSDARAKTTSQTSDKGFNRRDAQGI
jgi:glycosyltransferase involved in cell wall biosynthesis